MKAPNKIYINIHPLGVDYSIVPIPDFGGVEYLRKDALLEKLNRARELRIKAGAKEQSEGIRVIDALTDLINGL